MAQVEIEIDKKKYPSRQTMGAMLRFKRETGKEVTEIDGSFSDLCTYLWCCTVSACKHDKIDFDMDLIDFADSIDPDEMARWAGDIQGDTPVKAEDPKAKKKSSK